MCHNLSPLGSLLSLDASPSQALTMHVRAPTAPPAAIGDGVQCPGQRVAPAGWDLGCYWLLAAAEPLSRVGASASLMLLLCLLLLW